MARPRKTRPQDPLAVMPWYWRDWGSSTARALMSPLARGVYRELLDRHWASEDCTVPDNDVYLAALANVTIDEWNSVKTQVLQWLPVSSPGKRQNKRAKAEWDKAVAYRAACKAGGMATAAKRWGCDSQATARQPRPNRTPSPTPSPTPDSEKKKNQSNPEAPPRAPRTARVLPDLCLAWNETAAVAGLQRVTACSVQRERRIGVRLREEPDLAVWRKAFVLIAADPWCRGSGGWRATFDYALQSNAEKWLDAARSDAKPAENPLERTIRILGNGSAK